MASGAQKAARLATLMSMKKAATPKKGAMPVKSNKGKSGYTRKPGK